MNRTIKVIGLGLLALTVIACGMLGGGGDEGAIETAVAMTLEASQPDGGGDTAAPDMDTDEPAEEASAGEADAPAASSSGGGGGGINAENARDIALLNSFSNDSGNFVSAVVFSPVNNDELTTASFDGVLRTWSISQGDVIEEFRGHTNYVLGLEFTADGSTLLSGGFDYRTRVWDVESGREEWVALGNSAVRRVAFSADETLAAVAGDPSSSVTIYDVATGDEFRSLRVGDVVAYGVEFSHSGDVLAVGYNRTVRVFNAGNWSLLMEDNRFSNQIVWDFAFTPNDDLLLALTDDGSLVYIDTADWTVDRVEDLEFPATAMALSNSGDVAFIGGHFGEVAYYDVANHRIIDTYKTGETVWGVSVSPNGEMVAVGLDNGTTILLGLR